MKHNIHTALQKLTPGALWTISGSEYSDLEWIEGNGYDKPTEEEITAKIVELDAEEPIRLLRIERDRIIAETDWWVLPDRTPTDEQLAYRQALRDLPATATPTLREDGEIDYSSVTWPTKPSA